MRRQQNKNLTHPQQVLLFKDSSALLVLVPTGKLVTMSVELGRKIHRQPHATRRYWIARQVSRVHRDACPGEPLHVRHLRTFVNARFVTDLLLQNRKYAGRGALAWLTGAYRRSSDAYTVAVHIQKLIR